MNKILEILVKQWISKTPVLAKYIQYISIGLAIVTGLPAFLINSGISFPENITKVADSTVAFSATILAFLAQFTEEKK